MLLLDTNLLSEIMRPEPERKIVAWMVRQSSDELFTSAVCQAEIFAGFAVMPSGRRRTELEQAARSMFAEDFHGRVLPFDTEAAAPSPSKARHRRGPHDEVRSRGKVKRPVGFAIVLAAACIVFVAGRSSAQARVIQCPSPACGVATAPSISRGPFRLLASSDTAICEQIIHAFNSHGKESRADLATRMALRRWSRSER